MRWGWRFAIPAAATLALMMAGSLRLVARETACCRESASDAVDRALGVYDVAAAARLWPDAWRAAVASRRWEALLAAGDVARRIDGAPGAPATARGDARRAYHAALFRAHGQRSVEGVLRAAEAMMAMGDREIADAALSMARGLAAATPDRDARDRFEGEVGRLTGRASPATPANATAAP